MTNILFLIETIYSNIFRCNYLKKTKFFFIFFSHFRNLCPILNIFKTKMTLIGDVFFNLGTPTNLAIWMSKKTHLRGHFYK